MIYSAATTELADFVAKTGIPVGVTQAGKASLPYDHPQMVNALGASGSVFANALANEADVIIGIGTRYTDFTTASNTLFTNPDVQFVNINVTELDAYKESGLALIGDAREITLNSPTCSPTMPSLSHIVLRWKKAADQWRDEVDRIVEVQNSPTLSQAEAIGIVNAAVGRSPSSSTPPARCPGTCTDCGGRPTPRPTTSSTGTPAWATKWAAPSVRRWPIRPATSSASSATARSCCPARRS